MYSGRHRAPLNERQGEHFGKGLLRWLTYSAIALPTIAEGEALAKTAGQTSTAAEGTQVAMGSLGEGARFTLEHTSQLGAVVTGVTALATLALLRVFYKAYQTNSRKNERYFSLGTDAQIAAESADTSVTQATAQPNPAESTTTPQAEATPSSWTGEPVLTRVSRTPTGFVGSTLLFRTTAWYGSSTQPLESAPTADPTPTSTPVQFDWFETHSTHTDSAPAIDRQPELVRS